MKQSLRPGTSATRPIADHPRQERSVSTYCYQCVAGPDLLKVRIEDGVATEVAPNFDAADVHPAGGKACVKAFGLIQKIYNPDRVLQPMKRTNPRKGRDEDPGFVAISWDEALDLVAGKAQRGARTGPHRCVGLSACCSQLRRRRHADGLYGHVCRRFLAAWGPVDMSFGSGQGVKCYHSEHLYGELWHRAFTVSPDTPLCEYLISFGANVEASGGVCGVKRHADARKRGMKRVQIEPHLSVTGACSAEWIPIKPKTDAAFLFAMIHVLLHEHDRARLDLAVPEAPHIVALSGRPERLFPARPDSAQAAGVRSALRQRAVVLRYDRNRIRRWRAVSRSTASRSAPTRRFAAHINVAVPRRHSRSWSSM